MTVLLLLLVLFVFLSSAFPFLRWSSVCYSSVESLIAVFCSSLVELEKPVCPSRPALGRQARRCCTRAPLAEDTGAPEHHHDDDDDDQDDDDDDDQAQAGSDFHLHEEEFVEEHPEVRTRLPQFVNKRSSIISRTDRPRIDEQVGQAVKKVGGEVHNVNISLHCDCNSTNTLLETEAMPQVLPTCFQGELLLQR